MSRLLFLFVTLCMAYYGAAQGVPPFRFANWDVREFQSLLNRMADPCNIGLTAGDCTVATYPDPTVTVIAPAAGTGIALAVPVISGHTLNNVDAVALAPAGGSCANLVGLPANSVSVLLNGLAVTASTITIPLAAIGTWQANAMAFEETPRSLCARDATTFAWAYTGLKWKVAYVSNAPVPCPPTAAALANALGTPAGTQVYPMTDQWLLQQLANTAGCGVNPSQCYNPNVQGCANGVVYPKATMKACGTMSIVQWNDQACPCTNTAGAAATLYCPAEEPLCCLPTKYAAAGLTYTNIYGQCYDGTVTKCCDSGHRYDPGTSQCCVINGLQSLDIPCPCNSASHCRSVDASADFECCIQNAPVQYEAYYNYSSTTGSSAICNIYANYPSGTGPASLQACLGTCMDKRYQTCCNGATCMKNVESCCNSTCCNKYVGTCAVGRRAASPGKWQNGLEYGSEYSQCSTIEQMNTIKAFWVFVLPTELMFASFFCLAITLAFAARAKDTQEFSWLERIMVIAALFCVFFAVPTFFAPIYKYGVVVVIVSLISIISASARVRWLNIMTIFFVLVALIYLFDFVDGNFYLGLNSNRSFTTGHPDPDTMGVLHSIKKMFPSPTLIQNSLNDVDNTITRRSWCVTYYNYFQFDPQLRDVERFDNPWVTTFGYCSRAYALALYLFVAGILDFMILQFVLQIIALVVRFQHASVPAVMVEKQL